MDNIAANKSSDATGVSRSGRVRKKSSKLTDFESPDEIDTRFKRRTDRPQKVVIPKPMSEDSDSFLDEEIIDVKDEPLEVEEWGEEPEDEEEGEDEEGVGGEGEEDLPEYADPLQVDEDSIDVSRETSNYTQAQSLYFSEKQGKKSIVMKGGQVLMRRKKAQRKDKGKSRFTAYMLWAREVRPGIIQANPNMDFSAVNKRLGELWALVPTTQKYNWKRRAKRLAAKGNQKGGLISTGRPSRPPPAARANLINKGGVKPVPRSDPSSSALPPASNTQGSGHHRQAGQKVTKSSRKRRQPVETALLAAGECLESLHSGVPVLGKKLKKTNPSSCKKKKVEVENYQCSLSQQSSKSGVLTLEKIHEVDEESDIHIPKGNQIVIRNILENRKISSSNEEKVKQVDLRIKKLPERAYSWEIITANMPPKEPPRNIKAQIDGSSNSSSSSNNSSSIISSGNQIIGDHEEYLTTTTNTDGINESTSSRQPSDFVEQDLPPNALKNVSEYLTMNDILADLFTDRLKCPYCPLSLAQAMSSVVEKQLTKEKASLLYCVSPSRLQMCLNSISKVLTMSSKSIKYYSLLKIMSQYPPQQAAIEWLLRMKRMGRPPVAGDVKQVTKYLESKGQNKLKSMEGFLNSYGERKMSQQEWAFLSPRSASQWHNQFREHVYVRCGMTPKELLDSRNGQQVFTSAEILVSLGDFPREVTITRGRSNLYCLTRRNTGVFRAILTFSATGQFHPPAILQKGYELPHWALSEESVDLIATPDGRLDPLVFLGWLHRFDQRLAEADVPRPVVLFVHGHAAHGSPATDSFCCAKGIILHSHHHSPINLMDPFVHLISPLLYHFHNTEKQLTTLTGAHPLPDYLLPSILADAWTQVSQENLAEDAFQISGLVPYDVSERSMFNKSIQRAAFPPLLLESFKTYYACAEFLEEVPFELEPQIFPNYYLRSVHLSEDVNNGTKLINKDTTSGIIFNDTDKETDVSLDQLSDPLFIGPDLVFDPSIMEESNEVIHIHNFMTKTESSMENSSEKSCEGQCEKLPLACEIRETGNWPKSWQTSIFTHQDIKNESDLTLSPIPSELSKEYLSDDQLGVEENPNYGCSSSNLVSSREDHAELEIKMERVTPDKLERDLWIKEEMDEPSRLLEFENVYEDHDQMQSSPGKSSPTNGKVFIKMETDSP